jgi:hypothetical protein
MSNKINRRTFLKAGLTALAAAVVPLDAGSRQVAEVPKRRKSEGLEVGEVKRVKSMQIGGYNYPIDYQEGYFIHVRVLSGPNEFGEYKVTTRGEDGKHLGPGGGWFGDSLLYLHLSDLESIPNKYHKQIA